MNATTIRSILIALGLLGVAGQAGCQATAPPLAWVGAKRIVTLPEYYYPRLPALSPDGQQLAILGAVSFDSRNGQIVIWDITAEKWTTVEVEDKRHTFTYLSWDPTSTQLLFGDSANPLIVDLPTGLAQALEIGSERFIATWGPGEYQITKYILKPAKDDPHQGRRVEILNLTDQSEEPLFDLDWGDPAYSSGMDWSPNGERLLFSMVGDASKAGSYDIFVFDRRTGATTALVNTEAEETDPRWSPDGQWYVYLVDASSAPGSELVISSLDGACVFREPVGALLMAVDWGPADQLVVVYSNALYLVDMRAAFGYGLDDLSDRCKRP